ncbi:hypothetical protein ACX1C1_10045 [Paenibacillus sp. strain BS8-2]
MPVSKERSPRSLLGTKRWGAAACNKGYRSHFDEYFVIRAKPLFYWGAGCGLAVYFVCYGMVKFRLFPVLKWALLGLMFIVLALIVYAFLYPHVVA